MLEKFYTSVSVFPDTFGANLSQIKTFNQLNRRFFDKELENYTETFPFREIGRMLCPKFHLSRLTQHEKGYFSIDKVYQYIDRKVSKQIPLSYQNIFGVYAYEDSALQTFVKAKEYGLKCLYDLPIGYYKSMHRLLQEEREKNPDWAITLGGFRDSKEKLQRKDGELALADIIYVASSFTKKTLEEFQGNLSPIKVIPYGFPSANLTRTYTSLKNRKLKLLYVGGLSQRKGIAYLFDAVRGLETHIELTVVGQGNIEGCPILKKELAKHKYIPSLPHNEVLKLMATNDMLVFPSLFEGFGLVVTEAMSQGTPVITTERTCGPDIITHGKDGWLIEAGSTSAIRQQLELILQQPEILEEVGRNALITAQHRPWKCYGQEMAESVKEFI
jgi:glycosyltransferase involved in cell wall biosynthesis